MIMIFAAAALSLAIADDNPAPSARSTPASDRAGPSSDGATDGAAVPSTYPGGWATSMDYPAKALREEAEGVVRFKLSLDASGMPTRCEITQSAENAALDEGTCALMMERARFKPARDAKGTPIASFWSSAVRWTIPARSRAAPQPVDLTITFTVEKDGSVTGCTFKAIEERALSANPCEQLASQKFDPPVDANGNPVRRKIVTRHTVTSEILQN